MKWIKKLKLPDQALRFLVLLLTADLLYILLHVISKTARYFDIGTTIREQAFSVTTDLGLAESFQYVKEFWVFIFLVWLIVKNRKYSFIGWALMFIYLLFDDMLSFHEGIGTWMLEKLNIPSSHVILGELRYQDFGELGVSLFFGAIFFFLIVFAYYRGNAETRTIFRYLTGILLVIVFFGVFNDFANRIFDKDTHKVMYEITRLIEDGGEMLGMSIMCWYVYTLTEPPKAQLEISS